MPIDSTVGLIIALPTLDNGGRSRRAPLDDDTNQDGLRKQYMSPLPAQSGLTVFVPCFNDGDIIRNTYREIVDALGQIPDLELLFIDDGSQDDTLAQLKALAAEDSRVRYLSFARNFGLEAAQAAGFRYASRPWTLQLDSDLQNPPAEAWKLLAAAAEGYDIVFGVRQNRQDPWLRRWGSIAQRWVARRGFGIDLPPGASTFRVLRTGVARTLADLRLGTPYFIAMVPMVGARYTCVPTRHAPDVGRSRWRLSRLVGHSFELLFGYSWRPLNGSYLVATLGVLAASLLALLTVLGVVSTGVAVAAGLLISAATLGTVALLGRYLYRMMLDHRRNRPYYVREGNVPIRPEDRMDGGEELVPPPTVPTTATAATEPASEPSSAPAEPTTAEGDARGTVLILGASEDQLPVYVEARRRGYRTVAVDWWTDRPALPYADEHLHISTRDHDKIAAALGDRKLTTVIAAASDVSLESWHELGTRYQAPYRYPLSAALASVDKVVFHAISEAAGVPTYRWRQHTDPQVLMTLAEEVGYPLVAKPADSSGSKGVTLVERPEDLPAALEYAQQYTVTGKLLVEEFLAGRNLTVDVFIRDGLPAFTGITEKRILPGAHFVIGGHTCPAPIDPALREELRELAGRLCRAIRLTDGPANFDVIVDDSGQVRVLEGNARLCGNAFPLLMREVYGVDTVAALTSLALGEPYDLTPTRDGAGIIHVLASPLETEGVLTEVGGLEEVRAIPGVARCEVYAEPGTVVAPFTESGRKFGYLLVTGPDAEAAEATLAKALDTLRLTVVPRTSSGGAVPRQRTAATTPAPAAGRGGTDGV